MDQDLDLEVSKPRQSHSLVLLLHHSLQEDLKERKSVYRGSYLSAHDLLNLLNELGKKKCDLAEHFISFSQLV